MSRPEPPGDKCVVCGKVATSRCGGCQKAGYGFLYFCSREHQKLVWPAHRRVCSKKFHWPSFTAKEAQYVKETLGPGNNVRRVIERRLPPGLTFEHYIDGMTVEAESMHPNDDNWLYDSDRNLGIVKVRHYTFQHKYAFGPSGRDAMFDGISEDPFGALLSWQEEHWPGLRTETFSWVAEFQHLAIIAFGLVGQSGQRDPVTGFNSSGYTGFAFNQLMRFCAGKPSQTSAEKGGNLVGGANLLWETVMQRAITRS